MKVLELLEEIEEIVDTASGFPLTGKIMVDGVDRKRNPNGASRRNSASTVDQE